MKSVFLKWNQPWIFIGRTDAETSSRTLANWCKEPTHWKRPWCWERLKAGEEDDRGWDDWMASPTRWTLVWEISGSWWWTGKPDLLQSMGSQNQTWLGDWTELNWKVHLFTIRSWHQTPFLQDSFSKYKPKSEINFNILNVVWSLTSAWENKTKYLLLALKMNRKKITGKKILSSDKK